MKRTIEYPQSTDSYTHSQLKRQAHQRRYQALRGRNEVDSRDSYKRKHNSPDYNKYRQDNQNMSKNELQFNRNHKNLDNDRGRNEKNKRLISRQKNQNVDRLKKGRQLIKNGSTSSFAQREQNEHQDNHEYQKLHEKLNNIQNKIADMKKHVQKKRAEKQKLTEAKRQKERIREEQRAQQEEPIGGEADLKQLVTSQKQHKQLHTFQQNPYSPHHNIYYISEVIRSFQDQHSVARQHLLASLQILKVLENSKFASDEQMKQLQMKLPRKKGYQGKKTVIFDLDETLIHCNDTLNPPYDIKLPITFPTGEVIEAGINIRPHARQIIKNLSHHFEIIVFTASHSCYANVVLDYLDPNNEYIHHRLFRQHCYQTPEGMYCKDLRVIDRQLSQIVLVDNAAYSYSAQLHNGIPILPYYHGKTDFELKALEKYLLRMVMLKDVRVLNEQTFRLHLYRHYYTEPQRLIEELYKGQQCS